MYKQFGLLFSLLLGLFLSIGPISDAEAKRFGAGLAELDVQFTPGRLPNPLSRSSKAAAFAAAIRPNLFAGHVLVSWQPIR